MTQKTLIALYVLIFLVTILFCLFFKDNWFSRCNIILIEQRVSKLEEIIEIIKDATISEEEFEKLKYQNTENKINRLLEEGAVLE